MSNLSLIQNTLDKILLQYMEELDRVKMEIDRANITAGKKTKKYNEPKTTSTIRTID